MKRFTLSILTLFLLVFVACSGEQSTEENTQEGEETPEVTEPKREINLFDGARLHIAHVGQDGDQRVYFYKESCDFNPYAIDIRSSPASANAWNLIIHTETFDGHYYLEEFQQTETGLDIALKEGDKSLKATMGYTELDQVYSFYLEGLKDTLYVFYEEDVNYFDIMNCADLKAVMKNIAGKWFYTEEVDGERVIFEECRYGTSHIYIEESFIEFSGGGDARSFDLKEIDKSYGNITVFYNEMGGDYMQMMIEGGDGIIVKFIQDSKSGYYVAEKNKDKVGYVKESPCDEE